MAIVNPLLGTVTSAISSPTTLWNPPGDPVDPEAEERERQERERREAAERERRALLSNPVDRFAGVPTIRSDMPDFQVGFHTGHTGFSPFSDYQTAIDSDPIGAGWAFSEAPGTVAHQVATGYADQIGDQVKKARAGHDFWSGGLLNTLSNPLAAVDNYYNDPTKIASTMMTLGGPVTSMLAPFMGAISDYNLTQQAYNRAHALIGTPGYSYGMFDGQHYSTAPGMFGRGIYGTVPDWFDVEQADILENYQKGLDADGNPTTDVGGTRFSPDGFLSTPFGHDVPTYDDVAALAKQYGVPYSEALDAVDRSGRGDGTLEENLTGKDPLGPAPIHIDDDDVVDDPHADFSDMMEEEHSPW